MPQFFRNGPVVPDKLVQALEDDRVVIFCGAGISMGAGLPSYTGLVEHCYQELTHPLPPNDHGDWTWPDRMLGALESRFTAQRVRMIVGQRLSTPPQSLSLHRAILRLGRLRRVDGLRLVTTNFDHYFEKAAKKLKLKCVRHSGPVLPIPRNDRTATWRSLVYLHGRLGEAPAEQLVLTSADFGRAYLTDAWAARFVARLFADFTVLFVGYSLNDPVLRYMTDAFAAEDAEMRFGRFRGPAYIFSPFDGDAAPASRPFLDRNLEPIFYRSEKNHLQLKKTLIAWADARDDYLANVSRLIHEIAPRRPDSIDPTDTANLVWAVAGRPGDEGHGARVFAAVEDLPPIEWLDAFESRETTLHAAQQAAIAEAERAGQPSAAVPQFDIGPLFPPALDERELGLTAVGHGLIRWFVRHLGSEGLVERVLDKLGRGLCLHAQLRQAIRRRLAEEHGLPDGFVRFSRIVAAEGKWLTRSRMPMLGPAWVVRESIAHLNEPWLRQELVAALRPRLELSPSSYRVYRDAMHPDLAQEAIGDRLSHIADAEVRLVEENYVPLMIEAINTRPDANSFWAERLDELTGLLAEALHLYRVADKADVANDPSLYQRPSIVPHKQNHTHHPWTLLFDLIWQGWIHLDATDSARSRAAVQRWRAIPFLAFRRLTLAAMNRSPHFSAEERLEALFVS
jgi:hypothetical protein